jgi:polyferredoxin
MDLSKEALRRHVIQWCLLPIVLITIGFGWKWPLLGFSVPIVMVAGIIGSIFNGRYVCGNLCPRGSFLDRIISKISRKKPIPAFFRNMFFRWAVFAVLMGLMIFRISQNYGDIYHWGKVFWLMCVITTGTGVILGVLIHPRIWCAFCPMGTMQNAIGGGKKQLGIDPEKCVECRKCEKVCPFALEIVKHKDSGKLDDRDCLKCYECLWVCPKKALSKNETSHD